MAAPAPATLFRSATVSKITVVAMAATIVVIVGTFFTTGFLVPAARYGLGLGAAWLVLAVIILWNFYRLEVTFDGRRITLRYGLFAKRVLADDVLEIAPCDISWWRYGGVGIRKGRNGWAWITGSGPGVRITTAKTNYFANCERVETLIILVNNYRGAAVGSRK